MGVNAFVPHYEKNIRIRHTAIEHIFYAAFRESGVYSYERRHSGGPSELGQRYVLPRKTSAAGQDRSCRDGGIFGGKCPGISAAWLQLSCNVRCWPRHLLRRWLQRQLQHWQQCRLYHRLRCWQQCRSHHWLRCRQHNQLQCWLPHRL